MSPTATAKTGTVKFFDPAKGYGFVTDDETRQDFFLQTADLNGVEPAAHERIAFVTREGPKGISAVSIRKI